SPPGCAMVAHACAVALPSWNCMSLRVTRTWAVQLAWPASYVIVDAPIAMAGPTPLPDACEMTTLKTAAASSLCQSLMGPVTVTVLRSLLRCSTLSTFDVMTSPLPMLRSVSCQFLACHHSL